MTRPVATALLWIALAALSGCGRDSPTQPKGPFAITGEVQLTGFLVGADGKFAGTRVVNDADSVQVELRLGATTLGRATTAGGGYRFTGLQPGAYQVVLSTVLGDVVDTTPDLTIVDRDLHAGHTLALKSFGDLYPVPNPSPDAVVVYFEVPDSADTRVRIMDLHGNQVLDLFAARVQGLQQVLWTGRDDTNQLVTERMYWITYEAGNDKRAQLLFRDSGSSARSVDHHASSRPLPTRRDEAIEVDPRR
jgi:hypothetical protein